MAIKKYSHLFFKEKLHLVGSASSALFIYIKHLGLINNVILCPSNICYSIPFTIRYSGNLPLFYDVDVNTGNPSFESVRMTLNLNDDVAAIVIPHMFGNYAEQRDLIAQLCHKKYIKVIDDCAASLGMEDQSGSLKSESDAVIFSFGRKKHIDIGFGGLLATDEKIDIDYYEKNLSSKFESLQPKIEIFDSIYKAIFYSDYYFDLLPDIRQLTHFIEDAFVHKLVWTDELKRRLFTELDSVGLRKKKSVSLYEQLDAQINYAEQPFRKYHLVDGSYPWRFNVLCDNSFVRKEIMNHMLEKNLNVSIWYPPIDSLFDQKIKVNAMSFSSKILNFDFMRASSRQVEEFIGIINAFGSSQ